MAATCPTPQRMSELFWSLLCHATYHCICEYSLTTNGAVVAAAGRFIVQNKYKDIFCFMNIECCRLFIIEMKSALTSHVCIAANRIYIRNTEMEYNLFVQKRSDELSARVN